jgi:hypothetical protein
MENDSLNISHFLTPLQIQLWSGHKFQPIETYERRVKGTLEKLDSLLHSLDALSGTPYGGWGLDLDTISALRDTIGIYSIISQSERDTFNSSVLWYKDKGHNDKENKIGSITGKDELHSTWQDWLGDYSITHIGGKVIVSLSDEGVSYLNGIADKVRSYSSSYVTDQKESVQEAEEQWAMDGLPIQLIPMLPGSGGILHVDYTYRNSSDDTE